MKKFTYFFAFMLFITTKSYSQGVAINISGAAADASAMLDVTSTNGGMLLPRMTLVQRDAIGAPVATGLMIYQTDNTPGFYYYNGTAWVAIASTFVEADGDITNELNTSVSWVDGTNTLSVTDAGGNESIVITGFREILLVIPYITLFM